MARVQITVSDEDRDRFVQQAQSEGLSLSAWLRLAAYERLGERKPSPLFNSTKELEAFFDTRDTLEGLRWSRNGRNTWKSYVSLVEKCWTLVIFATLQVAAGGMLERSRPSTRRLTPLQLR